MMTSCARPHITGPTIAEFELAHASSAKTLRLWSLSLVDHHSLQFEMVACTRKRARDEGIDVSGAYIGALAQTSASSANLPRKRQRAVTKAQDRVVRPETTREKAPLEDLFNFTLEIQMEVRHL